MNVMGLKLHVCWPITQAQLPELLVLSTPSFLACVWKSLLGCISYDLRYIKHNPYQSITVLNSYISTNISSFV